MRVLVAGAAGFIGSNFVRRVYDQSFTGIDEIILLDALKYSGVKGNLSGLLDGNRFTFVKGDIRDAKLVSRLITNIDAFINFAAESHVDRSIKSSAEFVSTNIVGVQVILDVIRSSNRKIRFLQVSTDEVYGSIEEGSWNEHSPLLPNSPYSATKASADLLIRSYFRTHDLDVVITRCSNNYGPNQFPEKLIPLFIANLIEGKKVPLYGTGENVRDWLHVDDHCRGIYLALLNGKSGEIYNIGGGEELSNIKITKMILEMMKADESSIEFVEDRKGHDFRYSVDWTKIQSELGFAPKVNFEDGLRKTISWYQQNEEWWKPLRIK